MKAPGPSEKQFLAQVIALAKLYHFKVAHFRQTELNSIPGVRGGANQTYPNPRDIALMMVFPCLSSARWKEADNVVAE